MPAVFSEHGFKFHFYSNEATRSNRFTSTSPSAAKAMPSSGYTPRSPWRITAASTPGPKPGSFVSLRTVG